MAECPYGYLKDQIKTQFPLDKCEKCEHESFEDGVCTCDILNGE